MKSKPKNKPNASSEKPGKEKQAINYGDKEWQNPEYGEKKGSSSEEACGCGG